MNPNKNKIVVTVLLTNSKMVKVLSSESPLVVKPDAILLLVQLCMQA